MAFPQTQLTLVQRLASGGSLEDWQRFLKDYWGPICRFSMRFGARSIDDAEEVASETFKVLWQQRLLVRWASNRSAKLRTLLCSVVRNILSHRNRVEANRQQHREDVAAHFERLETTSDDQADAFYAAWVEDVVQQAVESLAAEYCRRGQVDYVRVLYGRLCQGMTIAKAAEAVKISTTAVDHYFRHARAKLAENLESLVRCHVERYCPEDEESQEFNAEWQRLGQFLAEHGGLEDAVRRAYELWDPVQTKKHKEIDLPKAVAQLTSIIRASRDATRSLKTP